MRTTPIQIFPTIRAEPQAFAMLANEALTIPQIGQMKTGIELRPSTLGGGVIFTVRLVRLVGFLFPQALFNNSLKVVGLS
jgi:hypothetical protein